MISKQWKILCLPLIKFFSLSPDDLVQKIRPYKKLLFYDELLNSYMDSNSKPNDNILLPRNRKIDGIIDSKIVNLNIVSLISRWIDNIDTKNKFAYLREFYLPYKFKLLLRMDIHLRSFMNSVITHSHCYIH